MADNFKNESVNKIHFIIHFRQRQIHKIIFQNFSIVSFIFYCLYAQRIVFSYSKKGGGKLLFLIFCSYVRKFDEKYHHLPVCGGRRVKNFFIPQLNLYVCIIIGVGNFMCMLWKSPSYFIWFRIPKICSKNALTSKYSCLCLEKFILIRDNKDFILHRKFS